MSGAVRVLVPAKINLYLGVGARREDGFHELRTVYQAISVYDEVIAEAADTSTLSIDGEGAGELPLDERNLAIRAATCLAARIGTQPHVSLRLSKNIPVAGGLAGGSADAAATLVACDALVGSGLPLDLLAKLAAELGSDVPFLLHGGTALGTGRGEEITPLPGARSRHWVVAVAEGGLSTPAVYAELDRLRAAGHAPPPRGRGVAAGLLAALEQDDPAVLAAELHNDLEPAALSLRPALRATLDAGRAAGALAGIVSGSGPTCVFLAAEAGDAAAVAGRLSGVPGIRKVLTATGPVPGARLLSDPQREG